MVRMLRELVALALDFATCNTRSTCTYITYEQQQSSHAYFKAPRRALQHRIITPEDMPDLLSRQAPL